MSISDKPKNKDFRDLEGNRYGKLTVLYFYGRKNSRSFWLCECDCGMFTEVRSDALLNNRTKSCGCLTKYIKHGMSSSSEYKSYQTSKDRCTNLNNPYYYNYGGRGIKFKFNTFKEFYEALGNKPSLKYSVERIDNDGNYEVGNVRWATHVEQLQNRRNTIWITYKGKIQSIKDWSLEIGINDRTLRRRICESNWCLNCSFNIPTNLGKKAQCSHKREENKK